MFMCNTLHVSQTTHRRAEQSPHSTLPSVSPPVVWLGLCRTRWEGVGGPTSDSLLGPLASDQICVFLVHPQPAEMDRSLGRRLSVSVNLKSLAGLPISLRPWLSVLLSTDLSRGLGCRRWRTHAGAWPAGRSEVMVKLLICEFCCDIPYSFCRGLWQQAKLVSDRLSDKCVWPLPPPLTFLTLVT